MVVLVVFMMFFDWFCGVFIYVDLWFSDFSGICGGSRVFYFFYVVRVVLWWFESCVYDGFGGVDSGLEWLVVLW